MQKGDLRVGPAPPRLRHSWGAGSTPGETPTVEPFLYHLLGLFYLLFFFLISIFIQIELTTLCKFKIHNVMILDTYCEMFSTIRLLNTSFTSHNYLFVVVLPPLSLFYILFLEGRSRGSGREDLKQVPHPVQNLTWGSTSQPGDHDRS